MIRATYSDKSLIVDILSKSFDTNKSVNYLVKQDKYRKERIRILMEYAFDVCYSSGEVFLSVNKKACALILFKDKKKTNAESIFLDVRLAVYSIGLFRIKKILAREAKVKALHPKEPFYYLWFLGVAPAHQREGTGTHFLNELIQDSISQNRRLHLETSSIANIAWYKKFGLEIYDETDLGYKLYFIRKI
jgi:hypothetical protein